MSNLLKILSVQSPAKANAVQVNKAVKYTLNRKQFLVLSFQRPRKNCSRTSNASNSKPSKPCWFTPVGRTCPQSKLTDHIF